MVDVQRASNLGPQHTGDLLRPERIVFGSNRSPLLFPGQVNQGELDHTEEAIPGKTILVVNLEDQLVLVRLDPEDELFVPHRIECLEIRPTNHQYQNGRHLAEVENYLLLGLGDHGINVDISDDRIDIDLNVRITVAEDVLLGERVGCCHLNPNQTSFFVILWI